MQFIYINLFEALTEIPVKELTEMPPLKKLIIYYDSYMFEVLTEITWIYSSVMCAFVCCRHQQDELQIYTMLMPILNVNYSHEQMKNYKNKQWKRMNIMTNKIFMPNKVFYVIIFNWLQIIFYK